MSSVIYHLIPEDDSLQERTGTVHDARKLALATKADVQLRTLVGSAQEQKDGPWGGSVYYARTGGFRLQERIYGTYYTRGRLDWLRRLWQDTLGRIELQSPIYIAPKRVF